MQQGTDHRFDTNRREPLRPSPADRPGEPEPRNRKARNLVAATPQTFTSKMLDYRSWWNLPGPTKARKTHS